MSTSSKSSMTLRKSSSTLVVKCRDRKELAEASEPRLRGSAQRFRFVNRRRVDACRASRRQAASNECAERADVERLRQKCADALIDRRRHLGSPIRADDDDRNLFQLRLELARLKHVP